MSRTAERKPTSVEAILEATRRVIAERGPGKLTLSAIAATAGVSRPTLYRWFPTKEALLDALTTYEEERFDRRLQAVIEVQPSAPRRLDAALRCLVTYLDGLMGPDPIGADPGFAIQSLASSLGPQTASLVRRLGAAFDAVPAVRLRHLSREQAAELFLRLAYSHYLVPHANPEVLLANLRNFAGLSPRSVPRAARSRERRVDPAVSRRTQPAPTKGQRRRRSTR
jgi:TetR/AcrR family transcriptional regulator, repressor for uid operon